MYRTFYRAYNYPGINNIMYDYPIQIHTVDDGSDEYFSSEEYPSQQIKGENTLYMSDMRFN